MKKTLSFCLALLLCFGTLGCSSTRADNKKTDTSEKSEATAKVIDLSTLKWEGGLDQYFVISEGQPDMELYGTDFVYSIPVSISQITYGKLSSVVFNIPYIELEGIELLSAPETVKMPINGEAEFVCSGSDTLRDDGGISRVDYDNITASGTITLED